MAEEEVQEVHHNLVPVGSSVSAGISEGAHHIVEQDALEKDHSHQPQPDSAEVEDIVGIDLAEDTAPEADRDSEEGIDLERGSDQVVDRKEPRMVADFRMEAGRTLCAFAQVILNVNLLRRYREE
jgi:hypothetical protein